MAYALSVRGLVSVDLDRRFSELSTGKADSGSTERDTSAWLNR
jgi:hypothetical protein